MKKKKKEKTKSEHCNYFWDNSSKIQLRPLQFSAWNHGSSTDHTTLSSKLAHNSWCIGWIKGCSIKQYCSATLCNIILYFDCGWKRTTIYFKTRHGSHVVNSPPQSNHTSIQYPPIWNPSLYMAVTYRLIINRLTSWGLQVVGPTQTKSQKNK